MKPEPTIGRIVHYRLDAVDVDHISRRRVANAIEAAAWPAGAQAHVGNPVHVGQIIPMIVTAVWPREFGDQPGVNGQCLLDGNDSFWVTSKQEGDGAGTWAWPVPFPAISATAGLSSVQMPTAPHGVSVTHA